MNVELEIHRVMCETMIITEHLINFMALICQHEEVLLAQAQVLEPKLNLETSLVLSGSLDLQIDLRETLDLANTLVECLYSFHHNLFKLQPTINIF